MSDACFRCGGARWFWNGHARRACPVCNPPARALPDPVRAQNVSFVSVADWPAVSARLMARRHA